MNSGGLPLPDIDFDTFSMIPLDVPIPNSSPKTISPMDHKVKSIMKKFGFVILNASDMLIKKTSNSFVYVAASLAWKTPKNDTQEFDNEPYKLYLNCNLQENQDDNTGYQQFANDGKNLDDIEEDEEQIFALKLSSNKKRLIKEFENSQKIMSTDDLEFEETYVSPYLVRIYDIFEEDQFCMLQMEYCEGGDLFKLNDYYKNSKDESDASNASEFENYIDNENEKIDTTSEIGIEDNSILNWNNQHTRNISTSFVPSNHTNEFDGNILSGFASNGPRIPECVLWLLLHDISCALYEIHSSGFLHLDVSPSNILKSKNYFKLGDFGTVCEEGVFRSGHEGAGPYVSPETLKYPERNVSYETDIFSFGVVLLEAASGFRAPRGEDIRYDKLRKGEIKLGGPNYRTNMSNELINVVNSMLDPDSEKRPTAFELMQHPLAVYVSKRRDIVFQ